MGTGEEPPARRENGGRRRRWMDGDDDDDDEEYVAEEEEEEDYAEELAASSAGEEGEDSDAEYQEDEEEEEDEDEETPRVKRPVKGGSRGRKGKIDPAIARARRRKYEEDDDYEEEELDEEEEVEEYHEEIEEQEEEPPRRPKSLPKCGGRGRNSEQTPAVDRSNRRRHEEEVMDFEPELDEEEEEVDEDIDFDPEVDDEEEDEFEDEEDEEFGAVRSRKVTVKNPAKRKSVSKRQTLKKKTANKGSKGSRRKTGSSKAKKSAPNRRQRKRFVVDDSEEESDEDDDFIVEEEIDEDRHPRKKARTGPSKRTELDPPVSVVEEETWPNVDSDTSDFEFVTSDEEHDDDAETTVIEASAVRKKRKKRKSGSESSSGSEFVVSDKEVEDLGKTEPPKALPALPTPVRKISITRHGEDKGKEKYVLEEAGNPICGICLSEEQRATVQGVLNCCSHYFCFACIMEWSRVESRCPLCKQRFTTITKSSKADLGLGVRKAVIKVEERDQVYQPTEEEIRRWLDPYENVVCIECNQGGDDSLMLLCDICDSSAHTYCVGLGREVPEGNWYCGGCRLSDEGPSYARIPHTVGYERQNYRNHVHGTPVGFGTTAQNGSFQRAPSINPHRSFQGFDLNLSPREVSGEINPAESQVSTDSVSTPGRRATVSGRRQIHRYIRILLSRPRPVNRVEISPDFLQHSGAVPRTEPNLHSFRSLSEANTSQILPDVIQNQHNGLPLVQAHSNFAPSMSLGGDDFQHIEGVRSNLKNAQ